MFPTVFMRITRFCGDEDFLSSSVSCYLGFYFPILLKFSTSQAEHRSGCLSSG